MPEVHFHFGDFVRFASAAIFHDFSEALNKKRFIRTIPEIVAFRLMQYWGTYRGHNEHRVLSRAQKEVIIIPKLARANNPAGRRDMLTRRKAARLLNKL